MQDPRKEHRLGVALPLAGLVAATVLVCSAPAWTQQRTHNPWAPKPKPAPTQPAPTQPAPTQPTAPKPAPTSPTQPPKPAPTQPQPPATNPTPPAPKPPVNTNPSGSASIATASPSMRGLVIRVDARTGGITLARHGFPPLPMKVAAGAAITRDGVPAKLTDLGTGSQTSAPDAVLLTAAPAADGSMLVSKIKARSRNHHWYGRLVAVDPSTTTIRVARADGQQRAFHLHPRTTVSQFGANNVPWSAMKIGSMVEVIWIPGDSSSSAAILEADRVILNKPYAGFRPQPPVRR